MSAVTLSTSTPGSVTNNNNNNTNNGAIELTESGGRALKLQTDAPHLVSLGGGRLSTAVTLHPIPQGRITLGSGPGVDIIVQGTGVEPLHCHIENSGGIVTLYPLADNLSVDGVNVAKPIRLSQGVMLTIGRSNYLRFNHPAEAQLMKSVLPNARISMAPIKFNLENNEDVQYAKKPPTIPRRNSDEEPPANNIQMKVSKFEYLAAQNFKQSISPKVFSSNSVTVNTPAKDVLGRAPPDLQDFAKNLPQPAINYSDSSYNDKQKNKTLDRQFFGRKSPQYVNVAVNNDTKAINNRVAIYENGCIPKQPNVLLNVNLDQQPKNELNNMNNKTINTNHVNKSLNVSRTPPPVSSFNPSPSFNRNQPQYFRSVTPNPSPNINVNLDRKSSGSLNELNKSVSEIFDHVSNEITQRREDAETRRNQAHADRVKEQQIEKAEQARLEEILSMCAEYERQAQWEKNNKPTPNRIKTNGSLPRDKRQCPPSPYSSSSPIHATPSPNSRDGSIFQFDLDKTQNEENYSYENVSLNRLSPRDTNSKFYYENVEIRSADNGHSNYVNSYENVHIIQPNSISPYPHSPRTRIKTIPTLSKESSPKDPPQLIDQKYSILSAEQTLLENLNKDIPSENTEGFDTPYRKPTPTKTFLLIDKNCDSQNVAQNTFERNKLMKEKNDADKQKLDTLKKKKHIISTAMANTKRKMSEIRMQEEELNRELEMERALINGEYKSKLLELEEVENRKQELIDQAREIELKMKDCQVTQGEHQDECKRKLDQAQENMNQVEQKLHDAKKGSSEYQELFEEFLSAQEILDNERKTFEDLEFHHLEEEADWLATREEIQREILDLSKRIDLVKTQISELEQQTVDTSQNNIKDLAVLETQLIKCLQSLEEKRINLKTVESEMRNISKQESDQEVSTDSDSDKPKGSNDFRMANMSCSFIDTRTSSIDDVIYNMSQSFNEKLFLEKSILEGGMARRCPSQDDIDRISKVTSNAPISIEDGRGSLGKKTIESLKEIERNRQLHLVQEGSKVIEEERRRVFELKQRAQNEVRTEWAKRQQNCTSLTSIESDDLRNSITGSDEIDQKRTSREEKQNENDVIVKKLHSEPESPESPRPLSETSDISVEVGPLGKRKPRQNLDKTRPLTRYLPIRSAELDLRQHIESAGHQVVLCPHVIINSSTCRGFLHKKGSKLNGWSRRWFVLDRLKRTLVYYADKSEKKVRGGAYFQAIEEVYLDHSNSVKSPNPHLTFIIKTHQRHYYLMAPSPEAMRIWIDVVFTGAEGYQEFEHGT